METRNRYSERIAEVFLNGTWIANANYQSVLSDISYQEAIARIDGLNTIYQLTFHINYYVAGLCEVYMHGKLNISDQFSFPDAFPQNEEEWEAVKIDFFLNVRNLISLVNQLSESDFSAPFVHPQYGNNARNLDALIEHAYYHFGQITLIKKMLSTPEND